MHLNLRTRLILAAIGLVCSAPALATFQRPELILIDGAVYYLSMEGVHRNVPPLQALWRNPKDKLDLELPSTRCWRSYVGIWEIHDDALYLRALDAWHDFRTEKKVSMGAVFPKRFNNGRVLADWFRGQLMVSGGWISPPFDDFTLRFAKGRLENPNALRVRVVSRDHFTMLFVPEGIRSRLREWQSSAPTREMFLLNGTVYYLAGGQTEGAFPTERLWEGAQPGAEFCNFAGAPTSSDVARRYRAMWEVHENELYILALYSSVLGTKAHLKTLFPNRLKNGRVKVDWFSGELNLVTVERVLPPRAARRVDPPLNTPKVTLQIEDGRVISVTEHDRVIDWTGRRGIAGSYTNDEGIEGNRDVVAFTDFESEDWRKDWSGGQRPTVSVVSEDPERGFEPLLGKALRIKVTKGGHYGASLQYRFKDKTGSEPEEIYFRYYLRLGSDWDPARGGKLPGIGGTYGRAGWGGRPSNGRNGWSARGQFNGRKDGKTPIGFYCYHADMKGRYGSSWIWDKDGLGYLENNRWYCIEQRVRLNTPGENDGVLEGWVDGKLAFRKTDVRMRDVSDLKIECIWINVYHGGTWSAESDDHLYIDNVVIAKRNIGPIEQSAEDN
jgi:hypothetical protein